MRVYLTMFLFWINSHGSITEGKYVFSSPLSPLRGCALSQTYACKFSAEKKYVNPFGF